MSLEPLRQAMQTTISLASLSRDSEFFSSWLWIGLMCSCKSLADNPNKLIEWHKKRQSKSQVWKTDNDSHVNAVWWEEKTDRKIIKNRILISIFYQKLEKFLKNSSIETYTRWIVEQKDVKNFSLMIFQSLWDFFLAYSIFICCSVNLRFFTHWPQRNHFTQHVFQFSMMRL